MSEVDISYKGNVIASMDDSGTKTLLTQGKYCEGNISVEYARPSTLLVPYAIRPDAELIHTHVYDKYIVADEGVEIPAYTTSAKTLKASANITPTVHVDLANYRYLIVERFLSIPEYSIDTKGKGRCEYQFVSYHYEIAQIPANKIHALSDTAEKITGATNMVCGASCYREVYWTSSSAIGTYSTNTYGITQAPSAPAVSGSTLTLKSPALGLRGNTTYLTSTYYNAITDIRYQYVFEVYQVPETSLNVIGWTQDQVSNHIVDCVNSADHKLT